MLNLFSNEAPEMLIPFRIVAGVALIGVICLFIFVVRHIRGIERLIVKYNLEPELRGPRYNAIFIICMVTLVITSLLVYLVLKA